MNRMQMIDTGHLNALRDRIYNINLLWHIDKRLEYAECKGALRKLPVNFNTRCRNRL